MPMASSLTTRRAPLLLPRFSAVRTTAPRSSSSYRHLSSSATTAAASLTYRPPSSSPRIAQSSRICVTDMAARRAFSSAPRPSAPNTGMKRMMADMQRRRVMPSMNTMTQDKLDELPNDMGLMPETFVRPTGRSLPEWRTEPKLRWKVEKHWVKTRFFDIVSRLVYKWTTVKPRPTISRRGLPKLALQLHNDMYTAFAYGDVEHLGRICTDGIYSSFRARINARKPDERLYWMRLSASRPRMVSDRVVKIPVPGVPKTTPCCVRQIIFRIKSKQALVMGQVKRERGGKEKVLDGTGAVLPVDEHGEVTRERMEQAVREPVEYFVLQKRMWMGKEEQWFVWGLVNETSIDEVL